MEISRSSNLSSAQNYSLRFGIWFPRLRWSSQKIIFSNKRPSFWKTVLFLDLTCSTSLVAILYLFSENAEDLFDFEGASQPRIQCNKPSANINVLSEENTSYHIMVERFCLTSTKDFIKGFGVLMASFYVFNVEHTKKGERSLIFVQKLFLNISDKERTPQKVFSSLKKDEVFI